MTNREYIEDLIAQAEDDFGASGALAIAGYLGQSLFYMHLSLEKLCKALWIRKNDSMKYPYVHNLIKLLTDLDVSLTQDQKIFYSDMNRFQAKGRYPDTLHEIEETVTPDIFEKYSETAKKEIQWLTEQMQ
jgi:HEPN domain-containing protein